MTHAEAIDTKGKDLERLYQIRFSQKDRVKKEKIWQVLCRNFFQHWIPTDATVLEIASGYGEFIRNIRAGTKHAVDLNPEAKRVLGAEVNFHFCSATKMDEIPTASIDVIFSSNFFEHLRSKDEMDLVLKEANRILKPGGYYLSLQPNLKYCKESYWDYYDHELPLTHLSASEAFMRSGFEIEHLIPRFLPYTMKSRLPQGVGIVRLYLALPFVWPIFGKQFFLVAKKTE